MIYTHYHMWEGEREAAMQWLFICIRSKTVEHSKLLKHKCIGLVCLYVCVHMHTHVHHTCLYIYICMCVSNYYNDYINYAQLKTTKDTNFNQIITNTENFLTMTSLL